MRFNELAAAIILAAALTAGCGKAIQSEAPPPAAPAAVDEANQHLQPQRRPIAPGASVPDFLLEDQAGRAVSASELTSGKGAVLVFLPPASAPAARPAFAWAKQHSSLFRQRGLELLLVTPSSQSEHASLARAEELRVALLSDPASWVARAMGLVPRDADSPERAYTVVLGGDSRIHLVQPGLPDPSTVIMAAETRPGTPAGSVFDGLF